MPVTVVNGVYHYEESSEFIEEYIERVKKTNRLMGPKCCQVAPDDYILLLKQQNNKCGLCKESFNEEDRPVIDHDHATGKRRGIIHRSCNHAIGFAKDNIEILENGITYLKKHSSNQPNL